MEMRQPTSAQHTAVYWTGAWLIMIMVAYAFLDRPIATFSHTFLHRPAFCVWLTWISDAPAPVSTACLTAASVAMLFGWRPGPIGRIVLIGCLATLAAIAAKDVLKTAFGRPWPETWVDNNPSWIKTATYGFFPFHGGRGYASFPSGHTTAITTPCAIAWRHARPLRPLAIALPVLVALGLLGADFHFLSDCLAGAALGLAVAALAEASRK
jgi:membrane-associated phospholipid phosphatase